MRAVLKLLPVIDTIERATNHVPDDLKDNKWALGVIGLRKQLGKMLGDLRITKIDSKSGTLFNPSVHEAIQFDEDSEGDKEVIAEELQPGYEMNGMVIRHAMVRVTRK
jgi:molecular chaperone GrpE